MTEKADEKKSDKPPRFRSAPYPAITLPKAIERAAVMYEKALHHSVPVSVPAEAWGYTIKSSGLFATVAALKQYGLILDEGSGDKRRFRLSDDALRISKDPDPASDKRVAAIHRAALAPPIYKELWEKFGSPSASGTMDMVLKTHLTLDRADEGHAVYSGRAADDIISGYQKSVSYSGLMSVEDIPSEEEGGVETLAKTHADEEETVRKEAHFDKPPPPPPAVDGALNDIRVELAGGEVKLSARMDLEGLEKLEKKIKALKEFMS